MIKYKTPNELSEQLKKFVIGQDSACDTLSLFLFQYLLHQYTNMGTKNYLQHAPVCLLMGESGSGKTFLVKVISKLMGFNLFEVNAKGISQEGWVGTSFIQVIEDLVLDKLDKVQNSKLNIIFIDEFDKICQPLSSSDGDNVNIHVQNSILKYLEGFKLEAKKSSIDLKHFCFILGGNFQGLRDEKEKELNTIGFKNSNIVNKDRLTHDLERYGMVIEIIGRISHFIELNSLTKSDFKAILTNTTSNFFNYREVIENLGMKVNISAKELDDCAENAVKLKAGVRGLTQEINKLLIREISQGQDKLKIVADYFNYLEESNNNLKEFKNGTTK